MNAPQASRLLRFVTIGVLTLVLTLASALVSTLGWSGLPQAHTWAQVAQSAQSSAAQPVQQPLQQQVQLGVDAYRSYQYRDAIALWETALFNLLTTGPSLERAIILENLARAHQQLGEPSAALAHWHSATADYVALQSWQKAAQALTEQAQTYSQLGQPYQAIGLLCVEGGASYETDGCEVGSAIAIAQQTEDLTTQVAALGSLAEAYRAAQNFESALSVLQEALTLSEMLTGETLSGEQPRYQALLHNSAGNLYKDQAEFFYQQALAAQRSASGSRDRFDEAAQVAQRTAEQHFEMSQTMAQQEGLLALEVKARLGLMAVFAHTDNQTQLASLRQQAIARWEQLPANQEKVYLALQLARQPRFLAGRQATVQASRTLCTDLPPTRDASQRLLIQANDLANTLGNNRLKAFTQGEIGHAYECAGDYAQALDWTQQARLSASGDRVLALDTLYLWQWQTGRIYHQLQQTNDAIAFYTQAVTNLNRVRDEILSSNRALQFDFRDAVAPVYRELAEIQLSLVPAVPAELTSESPELFAQKTGQLNSPTTGQQTEQQTGSRQAKILVQRLAILIIFSWPSCKTTLAATALFQ